jgi:ABC-type antimicrobial peptide transport system permease subunit
MFIHYIKVAFRNMRKYKYQTLVSVIGLAVGFACFAVATLWIRYEMTFDSFHKNADRIYCLYRQDNMTSSERSRSFTSSFGEYLKETFPEIVRTVSVVPKWDAVRYEDINYSVGIFGVDSSFFGMFDVKIIEGSMDFLIPDNRKMAITRKKALQMFGNENPLGKVVEWGDGEQTICAVVTGFPQHTNYPFDFLEAASSNQASSNRRRFDRHVFIELHPGVDVKALERKLYEHKIERKDVFRFSKLSIIPLTSIHYKDSNILSNVKFQHIVIFSVAGLLLVLCTLINYFTLFISRFRIRQRELALRVVYGASNRSLLALLSVEFIVSLSAALLLGLFLVYLILPDFLTLSGVRLEQLSIYSELLTYIAGIIVIALPAFVTIIALFRRRSLNASIRSVNRRLFRKTSTVVQLIICIGFMFCTAVILKQMYHLHNTDLGFAYKNSGSVIINTGNMDKIDVLENKISQIPDIMETIKGDAPVLPVIMSITDFVNNWDYKPVNAEQIAINTVCISEQYQKYYELKLVEGEFLSDNDDPNLVLINESAVKSFGWNTAVGKQFRGSGGRYRVKGVVKNIYNTSPTIPAQPMLYNFHGIRIKSESYGKMSEPSILFKFREGTWKSCRRKIEEIIKAEYPEHTFQLTSTEEEYNKFLKSENTLLKILTLISLVCVAICIFGFVSMVSLTCEERRKEIAIRKINGATIKDILDIFFKEYLTLLIIGALIAFPVGYLIMKRWLEGYVVQTEMSAWMYVAILLALIMTIVICVGGRVYRTSRENPVEAIKG